MRVKCRVALFKVWCGSIIEMRLNYDSHYDGTVHIHSLSYIHGLFSVRQSSNENNHNIIHFHLEMLVSRCYHEDGIVKIGSMFVMNVEVLCQ